MKLDNKIIKMRNFNIIEKVRIIGDGTLLQT